MNWLNYEHLTEDYDKSLQQFGPGPKALLWWDYRSMALRFRELVKDVPVEGKTIMDAGCGLGDLLPYLYAKSANFKYTGYDIKPEFIEEAKRRYEGHEFKLGDPLNKRLGLYDVVISSGVMNGNVKNWLKKRQKMIANLFDQTGEVLAFNMAGGIKPMPPDSLIAYADANEIYEFCKTLTKQVKLNTDYLDNDFTIVMSKKLPT
ncbi:class I SAM-dependent methyltransferase [Candidatus Saccharibacteria bacterium]|nr:class I SAM-dependent methyltransferase [Candidatus Saccharibacteria bacterium]